MTDFIYAGDTLVRELPALADFSVADGWSIAARLAGPSPLNLSVATTATGFAATAPAAETATLAPGDYDLVWIAIKGLHRTIARVVRLEVRPDPTQATDVRGNVEKLLSAIEATLMRRATLDQKSFEIAGRKIERIPLDELLRLRDLYRRELRRLKGLPSFGRIEVRF